jgi:predicted O-methyltransferase YrrM
MSQITTHGQLLATYIEFCNYKSIIEVGVQHGNTTRELCKAAENNGGYVYGYDYFEPIGKYGDDLVSSRSKVKDTLLEAGYSEDICELIKVDTQTDEFTTLLKKHFDCNLDFAFIDACHSYKGVKNDFLKVYPFLSPTGTIAFHDSYSHPGVRKFVLELYNELNDGTFDVINLPFGDEPTDPDRKYGLTFLVKRSI